MFNFNLLIMSKKRSVCASCGSKVYRSSTVLLQINCINKEYRVCTSCYVIKRPRVVYLESPFKLREGDEFVR